MESGSSDEDDFELIYWNNWLPPLEQVEQTSSETDSTNSEEEFKDSDSSASQTTSDSEESTCSIWIPCLNTESIKRRKKASLIRQENTLNGFPESGSAKKATSNCESIKSNFECKKARFDISEIFNYKKRMELHDVTNLSDGELIWGIVNLGVFAHIKLWINEYNYICALAEGTISKAGYSESTVISITNSELLRKMLCLSTDQWASLCETVQETQTSLNFDAFQDFPMSDKTELEKLWFFICKRRHFLPDQCMLVKVCGAVKCMKKLQVTPKVIVQEIKAS